MRKVRVSFPRNVLAPVKRYLLGKKERLEKRKQELDKEDPFRDPGRLSDNAASDTEAAEQFGHERVTAMKTEIDKALINIRKALSKIRLGKYGVCESCGKMIDTDRLAVNPTAELCIDCERKKIRSN